MTLAASGAWKAANKKASHAKRRWRSERKPADRIRPVCRDQAESPSPVRPILRCPMVPPGLRPLGSTVPAFAALLLVVELMAGCAGDAVGAASPQPDHVAVGPLAGRTGAFLIVPDAASRIRVLLGTLPGLLYRISTPAGSGLTPRVSAQDGRVRASLLPTGDDGPDEVRIVLNRDVRWDIRLAAGAGEQQLDLRRGRVSRVALGPSGLVELSLPEPGGVVPVTLDEGAGTVVLTAAPGTPMSIRLDEGAGAVVVPWANPGPAVPATVLSTGAGGYTMRAHGAVGALSVQWERPTTGPEAR